MWDVPIVCPRRESVDLSIAALAQRTWKLCTHCAAPPLVQFLPFGEFNAAKALFVAQRRRHDAAVHKFKPPSPTSRDAPYFAQPRAA
jgi:hypothetical protein